MEEFIEELKHNQKIKGTETIRIDYVVERLEDIENKYNEYFEVCKSEIITAIEDLYNDDLYDDYQDKIENISQDDINTLSQKLYDYADFSEIYENAREEILEMIKRSEEV